MNLLPPPGPQRTKQLAGLVVVGVLAAGVLWWQFGSAPAAPTRATSNAPAKSVPSAQANLKVLPTPVEFDKLEPVAEAPAATRNPFRFGVPPPPPPPPRPAYVPPPVQQPPPPPPAPVGPPQPPAISGLVRFLGRMVWPDGRVAASIGFLDSGRSSVVSTVWANEGQVVDGRFRIVKIGLESLMIEYVNGTGRTTLVSR